WLGSGQVLQEPRRRDRGRLPARRVVRVLALVDVAVDLEAARGDVPEARGPLGERDVVVRRLAHPEVPERSVAAGIVHELDAADALPGGVPELPHVPELRVERAAQELEESLVSLPLELDQDRPEPVAEQTRALAER